MARRRPTLACGAIVLRALTGRDEEEWLRLRTRNRAWLRPWEASEPDGHVLPVMTFSAFVREDKRLARTGRALSFAIEHEGALVGRVGITGIEWGSACTGAIGYWIDEAHAGRGIVPQAVAMLSLYGFREGLHRLEIAVRPENDASIRVAQKLGFREEGRRRQFLFIDGAWRDHRVFAMLDGDPRVGSVWDCTGVPRR